MALVVEIAFVLAGLSGCVVIPDTSFIQRLIADEPRVGDVIQMHIVENIGGGAVGNQWAAARVSRRNGTAFLAVQIDAPYRRVWLFDTDRGTGWR